MLPGCQLPIADALGDVTAALVNRDADSPVVTTAAGVAVRDPLPNSRRV